MRGGWVSIGHFSKELAPSQFLSGCPAEGEFGFGFIFHSHAETSSEPAEHLLQMIQIDEGRTMYADKVVFRQFCFELVQCLIDEIGLIVGRTEDDIREGMKSLQHLKAIQLGHPDIRKD